MSITKIQQRQREALKTLNRPADGRRLIFDTTGYNTPNMTSSGIADRLAKYAQKRITTVARILVLGQELQKTGGLHPSGKQHPARISASGAYYQAFQVPGSRDNPACHTSPALLLFDTHLPIILPQWAGVPGKAAVALEIVKVFADCVQMPLLVNQVDRGLDDSIGAANLVRAMEHVQQGAAAPEALRQFQLDQSSFYRDLLEASPREIPRLLGYVPPEQQFASDPSFSLNPVETAAMERYDSEIRQVVVAYATASEREPPRASMEEFRQFIVHVMQKKS
jgi:hypothetical protein